MATEPDLEHPTRRALIALLSDLVRVPGLDRATQTVCHLAAAELEHGKRGRLLRRLREGATVTLGDVVEIRPVVVGGVVLLEASASVSPPPQRIY